MIVPKGVNDGITLRMGKKGNFSQVGEPGDLLIEVKVRPHPLYKREDYNILSDKYISVTNAILGGPIKV